MRCLSTFGSCVSTLFVFFCTFQLWLLVWPKHVAVDNRILQNMFVLTDYMFVLKEVFTVRFELYIYIYIYIYI